jgi:hypothetical protein
MEIRTDRRTDGRHDKANSHFLQFSERIEYILFIPYLITTVHHEEIRGNKRIALRTE